MHDGGGGGGCMQWRKSAGWTCAMKGVSRKEVFNGVSRGCVCNKGVSVVEMCNKGGGRGADVQ